MVVVVEEVGVASGWGCWWRCSCWGEDGDGGTVVTGAGVGGVGVVGDNVGDGVLTMLVGVAGGPCSVAVGRRALSVTSFKEARRWFALSFFLAEQATILRRSREFAAAAHHVVRPLFFSPIALFNHFG